MSKKAKTTNVPQLSDNLIETAGSGHQSENFFPLTLGPECSNRAIPINEPAVIDLNRSPERSPLTDISNNMNILSDSFVESITTALVREQNPANEAQPDWITNINQQLVAISNQNNSILNSVEELKKTLANMNLKMNQMIFGKDNRIIDNFSLLNFPIKTLDDFKKFDENLEKMEYSTLFVSVKFKKKHLIILKL